MKEPPHCGGEHHWDTSEGLDTAQKNNKGNAWLTHCWCEGAFVQPAANPRPVDQDENEKLIISHPGHVTRSCPAATCEGNTATHQLMGRIQMKGNPRENVERLSAQRRSRLAEVIRVINSSSHWGGVLLLFVILHAQPTGGRDWAKLQCANCGGSNWFSCANKSKESNAAVAFVLSLLCYIQLPSHTGCNLRNNHVIFWWTLQSALVLSARDGFSAGKKRHFYHWLQF